MLVDVLVRYVAPQRVTSIPGAPDELRAPPSARQLATLPYHELHPVGLERRRAETIVAIAKRATRIETLRDAPFEEVRTKLAPGDVGCVSARDGRLVSSGAPPWTTAPEAALGPTEQSLIARWSNHRARWNDRRARRSGR